MDRDTREYCPSDWESVSKVEELEAEINNLTARLNLYKTLGDDRDATISELTTELTDVVLKNERLMAEIAELKAKIPTKYDSKKTWKSKYGEAQVEITELRAIRNAVIGKIDRMNDITPECGDSAEVIVKDFLAVIEPLLENQDG